MNFARVLYDKNRLLNYLFSYSDYERIIINYTKEDVIILKAIN